MRRFLTAIAALALVPAAPAWSKASGDLARYSASITRTTGGIPHIEARDWGGIGYGVGYAYAQDNLCLLAEEFATVAGERSLHFGPNNKAVLGFAEVDNLSSDVFFRSGMDMPLLRRDYLRQDRAVIAQFDGYVAGYNRWLRDLGPGGIPVACRGKPWVRAIARDDMLRLTHKTMLLAGSLALAPAIAGAAPPEVKQAAVSGGLPEPRPSGFGSNGWAFGGDVTANGKGLIVGNPHFPWYGPNRFWEMHITIPGVIDVMGVGLAGTPSPALGFNRDIAWTHTVTAARHFTLFQLKLDPADPTAYLVDGKSVLMERRSITVPMGQGIAPITRTIYRSRFGQLLELPDAGMGWTSGQAFALRDANETNRRAITTWMEIGRARTVGDVKRAVSRSLGIPWVNTIAADRHGNILHADVTAVPNVSAAKLRDCATPLSARLASQLFLLDGSRAACDWEKAPGTPVAGLMPARDQAIWERRDYVANSNDSYWLSNASAPYRTLSPILGDAGTKRSLRTRSGLLEIRRALGDVAGKPASRIDRAKALEMVFANNSLAAELVLAPTIALCRQRADMAKACTALQGWDGKFENDSRGAYLFVRYFTAVQDLPGLWSIPFDPADPVGTPRDLNITGETAEKLMTALARAASELDQRAIALDARWGDVQFAMRGAEKIPIHGADGNLGVLNVQMSRPVQGGLTPMHGSSYVQVVSFDDQGPVADAVLSYSQSTDPASPWFGDQTRMYSAKQWLRMPFTPDAIAAARIGEKLELSEPRLKSAR